jgi:hypothetical protein
MSSYVRENSSGQTKGLAEFLLEQLSSQSVFMDIDIIPGVWSLRTSSRHQHSEEDVPFEATIK